MVAHMPTSARKDDPICQRLMGRIGAWKHATADLKLNLEALPAALSCIGSFRFRGRSAFQRDDQLRASAADRGATDQFDIECGNHTPIYDPEPAMNLSARLPPHHDPPPIVPSRRNH